MILTSPLSARLYARCIVAFGLGLFLAVALLNLTIDPQDVFGTNLLGVHTNPNGRYAAFIKYRRAASTYDGLLFASSRGGGIPIDELARRLGVTSVANFTVPFGLMTDHLPVLEYVVKDKQARGERLKAVFLMLDPDLFGKRPHTNTSITAYLPPEETGEDRRRFWLRQLTAVQFPSWRADIRAWLRKAVTRAVATPPQPVAMNVLDMGSAEVLDRPTGRLGFAPQLALLKRFVAICRQNGVRLVVVTSPIARSLASRYDPADLEAAVDDFARIAPVWDFGHPDWLSKRPELWSDAGHFKSEVGRMMLDRIFQGGAQGAPPDFGTLRGAD